MASTIAANTTIAAALRAFEVSEMSVSRAVGVSGGGAAARSPSTATSVVVVEVPAAVVSLATAAGAVRGDVVVDALRLVVGVLFPNGNPRKELTNGRTTVVGGEVLAGVDGRSSAGGRSPGGAGGPAAGGVSPVVGVGAGVVGGASVVVVVA
jgi:hypothetical protein